MKLAVLYSMYTLFISTSIPFLVYKSGHLHIYCSTITIGDVNIKAVLSFHFVNNIRYIDYLNTYCKLSFNMKKHKIAPIFRQQPLQTLYILQISTKTSQFFPLSAWMKSRTCPAALNPGIQGKMLSKISRNKSDIWICFKSTDACFKSWYKCSLV